MADEPKPKKKPDVPPALQSGAPAPVFPGNNQRSHLVAAGVEPEETPHERVAAAVKGKKAKSLVEVFAKDVVALGDLVPTESRTDTTRALRAGAHKHLSGSRNPDELTVFLYAGQLAELLGLAPEPVRETPTDGPAPASG
jgi:hypothetical protein